MENCIFCEKLKKGIDIIYQDKYFFAQLDRFPVSPGHAEVIPKRHFASISEISFKEWEVLRNTIYFTQEFIEKIDLRNKYTTFSEFPIDEKSREYCIEMLNHVGIGKKPDGYNIGINEGRAAGRTVDHLHIHIIPRYFDDVEDPVGGIRNIIPGKGNYRK